VGKSSLPAAKKYDGFNRTQPKHWTQRLTDLGESNPNAGHVKAAGALLSITQCSLVIVQFVSMLRLIKQLCAVLLSCCAVLCCAVLCCAVLCCAVLCCAVLCCAVLCCAVLCCAVLCCAVLCCAVLCHAGCCTGGRTGRAASTTTCRCAVKDIESRSRVWVSAH
jgi:hypothetical protein